MTGVLLLLRSHKILWLTMVVQLSALILLLSCLLLIRNEIISDELADFGLKSDVIVAVKSLKAKQARKIAQKLNVDGGQLAVPIFAQPQLQCRFFTHTGYLQEKVIVVDGFEEVVDKKVYTWVANGEFSVDVNQIDMTTSYPTMTLSTSLNQVIGEFTVIQFDEEGFKLAASELNRHPFDIDSLYFIAYGKEAGPRYGPFAYDPTYQLFMKLNEEDLEDTQLHLLNGSKAALHSIVKSVHQKHLPFNDGATLDQLQLGRYETTELESRFNNLLMQTALLYDQAPGDSTRALLSEALFNKLRGGPKGLDTDLNFLSE